MTPIEQERKLVRELARALDDETSPHVVRGGKIREARCKLRAFYRHRAGEPQYFVFDNESKSLVPFESGAMKQDGWSYRG